MKRGIILAGIMVSTMVMSVGCGSASQSSTTEEAAEKTVLTFSVSPQKTTYDANENVTITMTKTGPESVDALWGFSLKSGSLLSFPTQTSATFKVKTGTSGFKMQVTGSSSRTQKMNGVDTIVVSGNAVFDINVL